MKVIAQSPFTKPSPATARGCVVIRENDRQYVVHNSEADEDGRLVAFYWGHYIDKDEPRALDVAVAIFCRKLIAFHGLTYDQVRGAP
jgi:hypothetical protein